jgi:protein involved in polysaccharide export with SLBB domain
MTHPRRFALGLAHACLVVAVAAMGFALWIAGAQAQSITEYRLGSGDRLKITVFGQADMSGEFAVDGAGTVTIPLVGSIPAARLTVPELTEAITQKLAKDFLVDPKVSIDVLNYRPFYVLGEVKSPGSYAYVVGVNMRQAIAIAGGFTRRARQSYVTVFRDTRDGKETFDAELDAPVLPGDTIEAERRIF